MAFPALAALPGLLAKIGLGGAAAKGATAGATKMAAGAGFRSALGKALFGGMKGKDIALRLAPDAVFGGMAAAQTPGDIGDKLIAGGTQFVGGGLGGLALGRGAAKLGMGEGAQTIADFVGSYGGDFAGMAAGDTLQRGKDKLLGGEGLTAWERMSAQQQQEFANQIRNETLSGLGVGPGYLPGMQDQYLNDLGLG